MSDIIQLLPDAVANQIAAGEVIQRPASVIKELVENAVDAGAKTINVLVVDAGRTSIQVIDDGCGMSDTDARLSFERHATSKIRKAEDLFSLHTMGFRGEALASIAAVAQVELKTRQANSDLGVAISISGSRITGQEPTACPVGSNFTIKNLFYNVPVRRKFLKSNATELNNILAAFERIALVYPNIHFTFHSNGTELYNLRPTVRKQRIVDIFGKRMSQDLLSVDADTAICKITGFVGKPESAKKKGAQQFFFVNGRFMKHPYFHKAVQTAFDRLIPTGEQVPYFIYMEVDAENIDVNIHPVKTEIKFENEQAIWQILAAVVKEAVGRYHEVPSIEFDTVGRPDIPAYNKQHNDNPMMPRISVDGQYNPFTEGNRKNTAVQKDWEQLYENIQPHGIGSQETTLFDFENESRDTEDISVEDKSPMHYQYKGQYIMTVVKSGLMIIDQHRAHMRILYEEYIARMNRHKPNVQKVLFPEIVQFSASEETILQLLMPSLTDMGFDLTDLGGCSYAVNGIPDGLDGLNITTVLHDIIETAAEHDGKTSADMASPLAISLAQHAAIPYGQVLSNEEMENIVDRLFACSDIKRTPDGHTVLAILPQNDIERMFGS